MAKACPMQFCTGSYAGKFRCIKEDCSWYVNNECSVAILARKFCLDSPLKHKLEDDGK